MTFFGMTIQISVTYIKKADLFIIIIHPSIIIYAKTFSSHITPYNILTTTKL